MDKPIYFSVCRYIPDLLRGESINVGIVTHIPEDRYIKFHKTRNLARIRHFDDEIEMEVMKAILESLEYQFNNDRASELDGLENEQFLKNELSFFVNQIQFDDIKVLSNENDSPEDNISDLIDMYLYYDKKKSNRINSNRVLSLASKMVRYNGLSDNFERRPHIKNNFEQDTFDFSLNVNNTKMYIKALSFDYKKTNMFFKEIKGFLYDIDNLKNCIDSNITVVINNTEITKEYEQVAYKILKEKVNVMTLEEFSHFIKDEIPLSKEQLNFFN